MAYANIVRISPGEELRQTTAKYLALGTPGMSSDGLREFKYARAGADLRVGRLVKAVTAMSDMELNGTAARLATQITTYSTTASYLRVSATWAGAATDPGGATGYVKNVFKDGYVFVSAGSTGGWDNGGGQLLHIKESTTGSTGTASQYVDLLFRDDERLHEAIDTQCLIVVARNPYDRVREYVGVDSGTSSTPVLGAPTRDITSGRYFWLQTKGPAPVLTSGTVVLGEVVVPSTDTTSTGVAGPTDTTGASHSIMKGAIGAVLSAQATGIYSLIDLNL